MSRGQKHTVYMRAYRKRVKSAPKCYQPMVQATVYPQLARKAWK